MALKYVKPHTEIIEVKTATGFMSAGGQIDPWIPDDDILE